MLPRVTIHKYGFINGPSLDLLFAHIAMVAERTSFLENQPNREVARLALTLRETSEQATMNYRGFYVSAKRSIVNEVLEAMASGLDVSTLLSDMLMVSKGLGLISKNGLVF